MTIKPIRTVRVNPRRSSALDRNVRANYRKSVSLLLIRSLQASAPTHALHGFVAGAPHTNLLGSSSHAIVSRGITTKEDMLNRAEKIGAIVVHASKSTATCKLQ